MDLRRRTDAGRRPLLGARVDEPVLVVEVELRVVLEEGHVRLPVGLDRPDVLPVAVEAVGVHAGSAVEHRRDDVRSEVGEVLGQPAAEGPLAEDVDAHRREVALRLLRLLLPVDHPTGLVHREDPHPAGVGERDPPDGDRHVGPLGAVRGNERLVVHLVDVVASQDEDRVGRVVVDDVEVLEHRVGRAAIPLRNATAGDVRLEHPDAACVPVEVPRPAEPDVVVERARVVLGQDDHVVDVRVHAVREREIDDPILAAERDGGLRANGREDGQPLTLAAGQDDCHRPLHERVSPVRDQPRSWSGAAGDAARRGRR